MTALFFSDKALRSFFFKSNRWIEKGTDMYLIVFVQIYAFQKINQIYGFIGKYIYRNIYIYTIPITIPIYII